MGFSSRIPCPYSGMKIKPPALLFVCWIIQLAAGVRVAVSPLGDGGTVSSEVGATVSLSCWVEESQAEEELLWHRDGSEVELGQANRFNQSRLCIQDVSRDDHLVTFTCHLKRRPATSASVKMNVFFPPELSGTENVTVEESQETVLSCAVRANPQVAVTWEKDGARLDLMSSRYKLYQDEREARLTITRTQRSEHQGLYSCVTTSAEFGTRTKSFQLTVEDRTMGFPVFPVVAGCVVVLCTILLAVVSKWDRIRKCWK
ncbi:transmembrane and immunoglobulin domain-containing protein 1-like isoform X1 [Denticeps clupeoides]|uniref:transmembrane and immunoglobulin domain-containing protein 1-like isoform X1 n=2 Tax=Denticeps clupeoides TaxID=299321 RepID=UPI0010A302B3|nr:transmembrane and immunoglobulin domain-containing protein 1-like isoform X1 [Denticeps clupeoides]